jgi:adenosylcobinamide kinase / adenosylcobinamide-phosphate guanylyltransferase
MLVLCLGGARSGKSTFALERALDHERRTGGAVTFIATSPWIEGDVDLEARIAAHRAERPGSWTTVEETVDLAGALDRCAATFAVVDCLTVWVSNLMWRGDADEAVLEEARHTARLAAARPASTIVISNEVGMGVHPTSDEGRRYRDLLGRVNQIWAAAADRALLLVAGRALPLETPGDLL